MTFTVQSGSVYLTGKQPPWRMSEEAVDAMLDALQRDADRGDKGALCLFNSLYGAQREAMGDLFIPRCTPRLVVDNGSMLRAQLAASLALELSRSRQP